MTKQRKRKSPIHHKVRTHNRKTAHVHKYERGHGEKKLTKKRTKELNPYVIKRKIPKNEKLKFNLWPKDVKKGEPLQMWKESYKEGETMDMWGKEAKITPKPKGELLDYWGEPLDKSPFDPFGQKESTKPTTKVVKPKEPTKEEAEIEPFDYWAKEDKEDSFDPYEPEEPPKLPTKEEKPEKELEEEKPKEEGKPETVEDNSVNKKETSNSEELVEKILDKQKNPEPMDLYEKTPPPTTQKDIPYYSRDDLEKMFLGDDEDKVRETAKDLGFEFEAKTYQGHAGEMTLEYRCPIDADFTPGIQTPEAYREVDFIFDLKTEKVVRVHSFMSNIYKP